MKIALLGYGKMGKAIEEIALERQHDIVHRIDQKNRPLVNSEMLSEADIAIDFSTPDSATSNIRLCFESNLPIVIGTTGWYDHFEDIKEESLRTGQSLLYATNFSIGVNLFFELNRKLAGVMNHYPDYQPHTKEIHHTQKLDSPSGTSITLAEGIIEKINSKKRWVNHPSDKSDELIILSERIEDVPGTHAITYSSEIDDIEIKHTAHSRKGFAFGAVVAAEWLIDRKGVFTMSDVLNVNFS